MYISNKNSLWCTVYKYEPTRTILKVIDNNGNNNYCYYYSSNSNNKWYYVSLIKVNYRFLHVFCLNP